MLIIAGFAVMIAALPVSFIGMIMYDIGYWRGNEDFRWLHKMLLAIAFFMYIFGLGMATYGGLTT